MKKHILPFVFATLFSVPAMSQGWRIAPTLGLNVSSISYSSAFRNSFSTRTTTINTTTGFIVRFQIGAYLDYAFSDRFSFRSGLLYTGKGGIISATASQYGITETARATFQFGYLEIPLLLNVAIGNNNWRLIGGPVVGLTLDAKGIQTGGGYFFANSTTKFRIGESSTDYVLPLDLSASLGLVKEFDLADRPLEIGLHVQPSFTSWNTSSKTQTDYAARNLLVGIRVAYLFELRR